jgi:hypothetical protein
MKTNLAIEPGSAKLAELSKRERIAELLEVNWKQSEFAGEQGIRDFVFYQAAKKVKGEDNVSWSES